MSVERDVELLFFGVIVKNTDATAHIQKMNKSEFFVFETYMTGYTQEKTAIERPIEYSFLPQHYYDPKK